MGVPSNVPSTPKRLSHFPLTARTNLSFRTPLRNTETFMIRTRKVARRPEQKTFKFAASHSTQRVSKPHDPEPQSSLGKEIHLSDFPDDLKRHGRIQTKDMFAQLTQRHHEKSPRHPMDLVLPRFNLRPYNTPDKLFALLLSIASCSRTDNASRYEYSSQRFKDSQLG